ncbi:MAG: hypothetical protein WAU45_08020 [Blastocatellia bacterium]
MQALKYVRAEDNLEAGSGAPAEIDPTPLLGEWVNTNTATRGIEKVVIHRDGDDVFIRVFGAWSPSPCDWGEARADVLYSTGVQSSDVMAFSAAYDFGFLETRLEANLSLGLLVIANLNTFRDGSGRSNYFSREFFYYSKAIPEQAKRATRVDSMRAMRFEDHPDTQEPVEPGSIDSSPFMGDWLSTNSNTRGIARLVITADDHDGLIIHAFGACAPPFCDWGEARGGVFADGVTSKRGLAFSAVYDFGFKETYLQAKVKKGVLVVANLNRFKDGSARSNYFSREFFYRAPAKKAPL